jgi:death-on-curing protein
MREPVWHDRAFALALHDMMLASYGGSSGIRDEGMLESALGKPRNVFSYGTPDLAELAASYSFGVVRNHPFIDGNKRTGFMLGATFLEINGLRFSANEESVVIMTRQLAAGEIQEKDYAEFLRRNSALP